MKLLQQAKIEMEQELQNLQEKGREKSEKEEALRYLNRAIFLILKETDKVWYDTIRIFHSSKSSRKSHRTQEAGVNEVSGQNCFA